MLLHEMRDALPSREGRNEHPGQQKGLEKVAVAPAPAAEDSTSEAPPPKVTKTRPKKATVVPRDALPSREGRNEHPGQQKGLEKKTRRTKAQMDADREAEKNRLEEAARKEEAAKQ